MTCTFEALRAALSCAFSFCRAAGVKGLGCNHAYLRGAEGSLELGILLLQGCNHVAELGDVLLHGALVHPDMRLDLLGAVGVLKGVHGVMVLRGGGRHGRDHHSPGAASETRLTTMQQRRVW